MKTLTPDPHAEAFARFRRYLEMEGARATAVGAGGKSLAR